MICSPRWVIADLCLLQVPQSKIVGTRSAWAPEVTHTGLHSEASDVYSLVNCFKDDLQTFPEDVRRVLEASLSVSPAVRPSAMQIARVFDRHEMMGEDDVTTCSDHDDMEIDKESFVYI